ncbi:MAG: MmgE/PrpD family protein [Streptosporangiales bacterium]|nr:MmgE/PrpD family protein [Streptosporangiales bacterium]MBO0890451.1 MmgE/PrpD family protein [Acidothermales bacterium]
MTGADAGTLALAGLAVGLEPRLADPAVLDAATRAVVDWFGATVAGSVMAPAELLTAALVEDGTGDARLVPGGRAAPTRVAALVNATASHTAEMDDIYREGIYHPGSPTVAAALALAQHRGASGLDLLEAVAVGYEVGDRIAETVNPAHYRFWHTTGTVGTLGAAAAAARLLGLDVERFAHALATATTMAAGLQQAFRSDAMSKPLHAGHAAEAGLLAAMAAAKGFTGALDILEGEVGFGAAMAASPDWAKATAAPGGRLAITRATVKNHSCCGHTFAAVDAALRLRADGLRAEDVDSIEVRTYTTATKVAGVADPRTAFEAKFSNAYCVAAAVALGSVRLRAFEPNALADKTIRDLVSRTTVVADDAMEELFPGRRCATVVVTDRSGETRVAERTTRKGDPDDPLTDGELAEKFADLVAPVIGEAATERLSAALWSLASNPAVRDLPLGEDS